MFIDIKGYEGLYTISKQGDVYSYHRKRILKGWIEPTGYRAVALWKDSTSQRYTLHTLVAQAYLPNPLCKPQINHIDGNKLNNDPDNLEWVEVVDNVRHAFSMGLTKHSACIDYEKVPSLLEDIIQGIPLHVLAEREGLQETSTIRKLLLREAKRTGKEDAFNVGITLGNIKRVKQNSQTVVQKSLEGNVLNVFPSMNAAARAMGVNPGSIHKAVSQGRSYKDTIWSKCSA